MDAKRPLLSIVCPAYQEQEVLPLFHRELCAVLDKLAGSYELEIIYIDDGSRDRTLEVMRALAAADPRVAYFSFSRNFGHQAALSAGLEHARGDAVISMDSDLQHPPSLLPALLQKWREGADVVMSIRADDERLSLFKRWSSRLFYRLMRGLSDVDVRAAASDFRLLSRRAVDMLLQMPERHRFLRGMVQWLGLPTAEIDFRPDERRAGRSKYTLRRMLGLASDGLFSFSMAPLRMILCLGLLALISGLGLSAWIVASVLLSRDISAWQYVLASTHVLGGAILGGLGILGEYVGRIFDQVKNRPLYVFKETSRTSGLQVQKPRQAA